MTRFINDKYINREYSWLQFNYRVLAQAADEGNPLLERCKFLSIFCSNLDEFYMVRVGSLINQNIVSPQARENKTQLTAKEQLDGILAETKKLYKLRGETFSYLKKQLKENGIKLLKGEQLSNKQNSELKKYFFEKVLPLLSPMVLDSKHPMIHFDNMNSYIMYQLKKNDRNMFGIMPINPRLNRIYQFSSINKVNLITIDEIMKLFGGLAFSGYEIESSALVRVTRNADFDANEADVDSEHGYDFSRYLKDKIDSRAMLAVVRLEIDTNSEKIKDFLIKNLNIKKQQCFTLRYYFDYKFMFGLDKYLPDLKAAALKYPLFKSKVAPVYSGDVNLIEYVRKKDIFLAYPFDSFDTLVRLIYQCAVNKKTDSIKITIYRLDNHSRIVDALKRASENGVEVTVVIELCARFDEENNLYYANILKEAGCTIIYGMGNFKVHSKIISIVMTRGSGDLEYITHLGTGNYNENTAKQYTDLNVITSDVSIGEDAAAFFRNIAICNTDCQYKRLLIAPKTLKSGLIEYIDREIDKAKLGNPAEILAKMNSLTDKDIIDKFIEAGSFGVKVTLIIRGICCLLPEVSGKTENISVISVVGRFLEHSRVYSFGDENDRKLFISSADLMTRNTDKRVEIATPILDKDIENEIYGMLQIILKDNVKALKLNCNGVYEKVISVGEAVDSQNYFLYNNR